MRNRTDPSTKIRAASLAMLMIPAVIGGCLAGDLRTGTIGIIFRTENPMA